MKRFKNILYITEGKDNEKGVLEKVATLARLNDAKVTVTRIVKESYLDEFSRLFPQYVKKIDSAVQDSYRLDIDRVVNDTCWNDVHISGGTEPQSSFVTVIQQVIKNGHDLVIKAGNIENGVDQMAMRLIRKCPCPVWVIRNTHTGDFRRILAAVDLEPRRKEVKDLNQKIVELAYSLAQRERGEAHYMHAWRLEFEMMMHGPRMNVKPEEIFEIKKTIRLEREAAFDDLLAQSGVVASPGNVHLIEEETATSMERLLDHLQIDVLVMGTVGRSGIPGLLIGNLAEKVLSRINCTVLTVKPNGFVSPVTV